MKNSYMYIAAVASAIIGMLVFQQMNKVEQPEHALYYQQPRDIKPFELTDHHGQIFSKAQLKDKWSFVFLGYTSCPDVCPTTLQNLGFIYDDLKTVASNSQILLVSVDPNRDTQEKLSQYIPYFNPEFIALRGEHGALFPFARNLGLMYAISDEGEGYLVDHSASIVLINPNGQIMSIFKPEQAVGKVPVINNDKLLSDFEKIVALY
jgi:protein SCO1/2